MNTTEFKRLKNARLFAGLSASELEAEARRCDVPIIPNNDLDETLHSIFGAISERLVDRYR